MKLFRFIGNLIWFAIYGVWMAVIHFAVGVALCATVVGIPFGLQYIKIARYAIWPFGRIAEVDFDRYPKTNCLWVLLGGAILSLIHLVVGIVLCITIIGIPFGKKCFKLCELSFIPFGATISKL